MTVDTGRVLMRKLKGALMPAIGLVKFGSDRYSAAEVATGGVSMCKQAALSRLRWSCSAGAGWSFSPGPSPHRPSARCPPRRRASRAGPRART